MSRKFGFIFMSIIVLGLIFNTSAFSNSVFADKEDNEEKKSIKEQKEIEREEAKKDREWGKEQIRKEREKRKAEKAKKK